MKKLIIEVILIGTAFCIQAAEKQNPLMAADTVVWAGLDYSMVRMIGTNDFNVPDAIFPGMLDTWNSLFIEERLELVAKAIGKRVAIDIGGATVRNKTAKADQIILTPGPNDVIGESHITPQDIAKEIRSYEMQRTNGLGLVFIVDRLVSKKTHLPTSAGKNGSPTGRSETGGAVYIVFFDVATREVISAEREVHRVSTGANFRNLWFGPIKDTDKSLNKYRSRPAIGASTTRTGR